MSDAILEELRTHLFIEFYFNNDKPLISEQTWGYKWKECLFEQYGVTNGLDEFAKDIEYGLKHNHFKFASRGHYGKDFPINTVEFKFIDRYKERFAYSSPETVVKRTQDGKSFIDYMLVYISSDIDFNTNLVPIIIHELTHAIEDNGLRRSGKNLGDENSKTGYQKYAVPGDNRSSTEYMISDLLYYFNCYEQNSFIAQMATELSTYKGNFETINDVFVFLRNTNIYQKYEEMFKIADAITSKNIPDKSKEGILKIVNNLSEYQFKTHEELSRFFKYRLKNIKRKFNSIIPKIVYQNVNMVRCEVISRPMNEEINWKNVNVLDSLLEYFERVERIWAD